MTAPDFFTLEGDSVAAIDPYIIELDDGTGGGVGGTALCGFLVNDQAAMPDPGQHPDARDLNQTAYLAWASGIMFPKLTVDIAVVGTTPSVASLIAPNRNIVSGDITPSRNNTGIYYISVPVAKLPQKTMAARVCANYAGICAASVVWASNGVYHVYLGENGAAIDCGFKLEIWGY
jgi:hypothetical protein